MVNTPLVSIIIPTFNRANLIGLTLNSVLAQTYTNFECIVVDDGSTDSTEQVLEEFTSKDKRIRYYKRPNDRPKGANTCRNYGFELSKGEYIQWFDSDDLLYEDKVRKQLSSLIDTKNKISLCNFAMFKDTLKDLDSMDAGLKADGYSTFYSYIAGKSLINMQIALIHRTAAETLKFDESLDQSQDLDFMYRLLKKLYKETSILDELLCYIRKHPDTITIRFRRGHLNELNSDIRVREFIFHDQYHKLESGEIKSGLLHRTLYSYRSLLVHKHVSHYLKKMITILKYVSLIKKVKLIILVCIGLFYLVTKKGLYIYGKFLHRI